MEVINEEEFFKWQNISDNINFVIMPKDYGKKVHEIAKIIREKEKIQKKLNKQQKTLDKIKEYINEHIKYECDNAFNGMQFYSYHLYDFNKEELLELLEEIK